ncbi:MAG: sorting domain protein [Proteobacteria bacterium]|nr:sorting domain protein [Pseudomonadota bacterium]
MRLTQRLILATAATLPGLAAAADNVPELLVPAYFYPAGSGATDWSRLTAAAGKVHITAIINPDSGAGSRKDPVLAAAIDDFKAAGGTVLGYLSTSWGQRSSQLVKTDIDRYASWYPVDGLFFDETATNAAHLAYYAALGNYAHQKNPGLTLMANPGTPPIEDYVKLFDTVVMYEDPASKLAAYSPPAYMANYGARHFGMLVIDGDQTVMTQQVAFAASHNLGYIYINDRSMSANEWNGLPAHWEAQVAAIQVLSAVPEPAEWAMLLAGLGLVASMRRRRKLAPSA